MEELPKEIKRQYLQRRIKEINTMKELLEKGPAFDELKRMGHQIKGNASSFGFDDLTPLAVSLEEAALNKAKERCQTVLLQIAVVVEKYCREVG